MARRAPTCLRCLGCRVKTSGPGAMRRGVRWLPWSRRGTVPGQPPPGLTLSSSPPSPPPPLPRRHPGAKGGDRHAAGPIPGVLHPDPALFPHGHLGAGTRRDGQGGEERGGDGMCFRESPGNAHPGARAAGALSSASAMPAVPDHTGPPPAFQARPFSFPSWTCLQVENPGDVATASTLAGIISDIKLSRSGRSPLVIFDIHALQERYYFGNNVLPLLESGIPLLRSVPRPRRATCLAKARRALRSKGPA